MITDYIDPWGLLDKKKEQDGGDSAQREGMYFSLLGMRIKGMLRQDVYNHAGRFKEICRKLHPHPGVLLRHCNPDYDASDFDRMSRDQLQPFIIACGYWSKDELRKFSRGHLKRGFLFCNNVRRNGTNKKNHGQFKDPKRPEKGKHDYSWKTPDITGPEIWANFIRGFGNWLFYPFLLVFDIELLIGAILWRRGKSHNIALNHTLSQMQATHIMPTPWIWLANKIMPVPNLIEICKDHLDDRHVEMPVFGPMFDEAWKEISK